MRTTTSCMCRTITPCPDRNGVNISSVTDTHEILLEYGGDLAAGNKPEMYEQLRERIRLLLEGETDWLANLGNEAEEMYAWMTNLNWTGWYLLRDDVLVLVTFTNNTACRSIHVCRM